MGISLLSRAKGKHRKLSPQLIQKKRNMGLLTRRGNYNVLAQFSSIQVFTVGLVFSINERVRAFMHGRAPFARHKAGGFVLPL